MARTQQLPKELERLIEAGFFSVQGPRPHTRELAKQLAQRKRREGYRARTVTINWRGGEPEHVVMIAPK
jgi:hypothetical protein